MDNDRKSILRCNAMLEQELAQMRDTPLVRVPAGDAEVLLRMALLGAARALEPFDTDTPGTLSEHQKQCAWLALVAMELAEQRYPKGFMAGDAKKGG